MSEPYYLPNGQDSRPHDPDASTQVIARIAKSERGEAIGII